MGYVDYYAEMIEPKCSLGEVKEPVGYLTPNGKWLLLESKLTGLAHLMISEYVEGIIRKERPDILKAPYNNVMLDLERNGWIKVYGRDVRYLSGIEYYEDGELKKTPYIREEQKL